jgi:hypothetical protein
VSEWWPRWLRPNRYWKLGVPLAMIAAGGGIGSYFQWLIVVQASDGRTMYAYFVAALADTTLFAASSNVLDSMSHGDGWRQWPWLSVLSFAVAFAATIGANVYSGEPHVVPSYLVRVWPAVAFLMALESLMSYIRRERRRESERAWREVEAAAGQSPREWLDVQLRDMADEKSERVAAEAFGVSRTRVASARAALNGNGAHE